MIIDQNLNEAINPYAAAVSVPRRVMVLFFIVDTSGSMAGAKIGSVNSAIEEVLPEIKKISAENADAEIKVAILQFDTAVKWITPTPMSAEQLSWVDLNAGGITSLGAACTELNKKLSRKEFMSDVVGSYAPVLFLLSDGAPTDDFNKGLSELQNNNWYKAALKVAIAIGDDANTDVLAQFTGNVESVITVHTPDELKKWIQFVSITSSKIGSTSSSSAGSSKSDTLTDCIKEEKEKKETEGSVPSTGNDPASMSAPISAISDPKDIWW